MNSILLFLLSLCQLLQKIRAQIILDTTMATTAIVNNGQCLCHPGTTCPTHPTDGEIDIRIVNMGTTCPSGQVYCCGDTSDTSCGISKIPATPHPPGEAACGAYPWQVAIFNGNDYLGGGVLVGSKYVLTAAHKVWNYTGTCCTEVQIKARLGAWKLSDQPIIGCNYPSVDISISKVIPHPGFNPRYLLNDIAVLRLSSNAPIATSPNINTACLSCEPVDVGTRCWVTGWGKNAFGSNGMNQRILKEVDVPVISQQACETALRKTRLGNKVTNYLDSSTMCAGGEAGKDACTGDGGSPLVCPMKNGAYQVKGLVTWGIGCADAGVPAVYADLCNSLSWIKQQMT
ncbi:unnamed protein product [Lasius platythorax]|uniref:Peptidase S1 domain-containing protein n=1 Tax=Lasius platythorax TaxID=488582 RepID=A0AAV2N7I9_9HYME